jgi:hypothetical protein
MTCKGYDSKAVKISKEVKRLAATYADSHQRAAFIRSYVVIEQDAARMRTSRNRKDKA